MLLESYVQFTWLPSEHLERILSFTQVSIETVSHTAAISDEASRWTGYTRSADIRTFYWIGSFLATPSAFIQQMVTGYSHSDIQPARFRYLDTDEMQVYATRGARRAS